MKTAIDPRHQVRRLALAKIYSLETTDNTNTNLSEDIVKETLDIKNIDKKLYTKICEGVEKKHDELLERISRNSTDWELKKIFKVDLTILLIATWELLYNTAPTKVVIDESVELAKEFGSDDSTRFINGVLAGITDEINNDK